MPTFERIVGVRPDGMSKADEDVVQDEELVDLQFVRRGFLGVWKRLERRRDSTGAHLTLRQGVVSVKHAIVGRIRVIEPPSNLLRDRKKHPDRPL